MAGNKLTVEFNKIETKRTIQKINKTKSLFFGKINKIDKFLFKLSKRYRENIQINKVSKENGDMTDIKEIQRIIGSYFKTLHSTKLKKI